MITSLESRKDAGSGGFQDRQALELDVTMQSYGKRHLASERMADKVHRAASVADHRFDGRRDETDRLVGTGPSLSRSAVSWKAGRDCAKPSIQPGDDLLPCCARAAGPGNKHDCRTLPDFFVINWPGISCGVFYLAEAGLLDGKTATTHWDDWDILEQRFAKVSLVRDVIFTRDGGLWTSAGVASGLDVALAMVEEDHGRELAMIIARRSVMLMKRPGSDSQLSPQLQSQAIEGPLAAVLKWIIDHPEADLRADALAERANMSLRNFYRAFEDATGTSPAEWVEKVRFGFARRLLEQTSERVDQVACKAGFLNDERMRRCFVRRLGFTPVAYRERFGQPAPVPTGDGDLSLLVDAYSMLGGRPHAPLQ